MSVFYPAPLLLQQLKISEKRQDFPSLACGPITRRPQEGIESFQHIVSYQSRKMGWGYGGTDRPMSSNIPQQCPQQTPSDVSGARIGSHGHFSLQGRRDGGCHDRSELIMIHYLGMLPREQNQASFSKEGGGNR